MFHISGDIGLIIFTDVLIARISRKLIHCFFILQSCGRFQLFFKINVLS